jgi:hypothetical protein
MRSDGVFRREARLLTAGRQHRRCVFPWVPIEEALGTGSRRTDSPTVARTATVPAHNYERQVIVIGVLLFSARRGMRADGGANEERTTNAIRARPEPGWLTQAPMEGEGHSDWSGELQS